MWKSESGRHHADDATGFGIEQHCLAEDVWIGAELRLPERVADYGDVVVAGAVVIGPDGAAELRGDTESVKEIAGDARAVDADGRAIDREVAAVGGENGETRKGTALALPVVEIGVGRAPDFQRDAGNVGIGW
jgi:hypothetical protein